jgi:septum formation protein
MNRSHPSPASSARATAAPKTDKNGSRSRALVALPSVVLASASPRRRRLLAQVGIPVEVRPADIDEGGVQGSIEDRVKTLAYRKAAKVAATIRDGFVLGADTLGTIDGEAIGKPANETDAARILWRLADRAHDVTSGVVILRVEAGTVIGSAEAVITTRVTFRPLGLRDIQAYVATGESEDKACAYAIQGEGRRLVTSIQGSYTNVVGLPLTETLRLLEHMGYPVPEADLAALETLPAQVEEA